jgi:hypothetical protein
MLIGACGTDNSASVALLPGFNVPKPEKNQLQFVTPPVRGIPAAADETLCTYLDAETDRDLDVTAYMGYQTTLGAHHVILYAAQNKQPADTHECNENDMLNARYLAGGGADSPPAPLPDGVVLRVPAHTQIMIQHHWINTTDGPIDGQAAFNITVEPSKPENVTAQLFTNVTTKLSLDPGAGSGHASCKVATDMNFFMIGGHAHELGTHITIQVSPARQGPPVIYDTPWNGEYQFNPPKNTYTKQAPFVMMAGDQMDIDCTYNNTTNARVEFPREMCLVFGFYFPADNQVNCVDGVWGAG